MKYLYIDESYDQNVFVVGGVISDSEKEINKTYNKFKKQIRNYPLSENQKRIIMHEFKSFILDRSYQRIKEILFTYISKADINVIYSYKTLSTKLEQEEKEKLYLGLLKNIINHINDDIVVITFDSFNNTRFNSKIEKEIKEIKNVKEVLCVNSDNSKGLQFADNVVGTIRRHNSGIDINDNYEIISNKTIEV